MRGALVSRKDRFDRSLEGCELGQPSWCDKERGNRGEVPEMVFGLWFGFGLCFCGFGLWSFGLWFLALAEYELPRRFSPGLAMKKKSGFSRKRLSAATQVLAKARN